MPECPKNKAQRKLNNAFTKRPWDPFRRGSDRILGQREHRNDARFAATAARLSPESRPLPRRCPAHHHVTGPAHRLRIGHAAVTRM
ncbi:hypothetical protein GA0115241_10733 [Streptomyces sp. DpondAA-D4]|nr:hypothetical protein YUMDRAFT_01283 [Streptomyces sp. OspMP-M45]SCD38127.1 hypothetical protein GA0115249_10293 [Streptomyces sp. PpalLS-921]SCD87797.1 hypothetical protein GA0115241_10733 [Streptomyces sp. DpondAA-D4]